MDGGEPDIPIYKVIECIGPTNTRVYTVAVYFRGKRLASSTGHSIQQAEMKSAKAALENSSELFPQLDYQKRVIAQSIKRQKGKDYTANTEDTFKILKKNISNPLDDESNLPKQYRTREDISSDELDIVSSDTMDSKSNRKDVKVKRKKRKRSRREQKPAPCDQNAFSPLSDDSEENNEIDIDYIRTQMFETTNLPAQNNVVRIVNDDDLEDMSDDEFDENDHDNEKVGKLQTVLLKESSLESGETD